MPYQLNGEDNEQYATPEGMPAWVTWNSALDLCQYKTGQGMSIGKWGSQNYLGYPVPHLCLWHQRSWAKHTNVALRYSFLRRFACVPFG